jgi:hypothetical protein
MKETAVEFLVRMRETFGIITTNDLKQAKEMEKEQSDNLAIGFGACLIELLNDSETKAETMKELLEIFKNK